MSPVEGAAADRRAAPSVGKTRQRIEDDTGSSAGGPRRQQRLRDSFQRASSPGLRATGPRRQLLWALAAGMITLGLIGLVLLAGLVSEGRLGPMDLLGDPAEVTGSPGPSAR